MVTLAKAMFRDMWDQLHGVEKASVKALKAELAKLETASERLMDRILEANTDLVASYEKRLSAMEKEKIALLEKIAGSARPPARFERVYRTAFEFLENPRKPWRSSLFEHRRAVLRMAFETHLRYDRNQGYRTPKTTLPFKVLASLNDLKIEMVRPDGKTSNHLAADHASDNEVENPSDLAAPGFDTVQIYELFETLANWNTVLILLRHKFL